MDFDQPIEIVKGDTPSSYDFHEFYRVAMHVKFDRRTFCLPSSVTIRQTTDDEVALPPHCRVYFISYPRHENLGRFQPTLFCADVSENVAPQTEIPWFQLVPDDFRSER
ncbi:unnamed protein product [Echinostoma caproni]|uniref:DUF1653 domain-containing protein n=1 Tax=Echinostoma caproni TaxID=27848 RepID=A0A183BBU4_9TREM|nr:unnamed protein product [Echinostoma caproni]